MSLFSSLLIWLEVIRNFSSFSLMPMSSGKVTLARFLRAVKKPAYYRQKWWLNLMKPSENAKWHLLSCFCRELLGGDSSLDGHKLRGLRQVPGLPAIRWRTRRVSWVSSASELNKNHSASAAIWRVPVGFPWTLHHPTRKLCSFGIWSSDSFPKWSLGCINRPTEIRPTVFSNFCIEQARGGWLPHLDPSGFVSRQGIPQRVFFLLGKTMIDNWTLKLSLSPSKLH